MTDSVKLAPSILAADFARLGDQVAEAERAGADRIHVDVMDGHFVPNISMGTPIISSLRKATRLPLPNRRRKVGVSGAPAGPVAPSVDAGGIPGSAGAGSIGAGTTTLYAACSPTRVSGRPGRSRPPVDANGVGARVPPSSACRAWHLAYRYGGLRYTGETHGSRSVNRFSLESSRSPRAGSS